MRYLRALKWSAYAALLGLVLTLTSVDTLGQGRSHGGPGGTQIQFAVPAGQGGAAAPPVMFMPQGGGAQIIQFQSDPAQLQGQFQATQGPGGFGGGQGGFGRGQGGGGRGQGGGGRGGRGGGWGGDPNAAMMYNPGMYGTPNNAMMGNPPSNFGGGMGGGGMGGPGGGRGGGGFDPSQMTDDQIYTMMQRYDLDRDGRISKEEANQNNRIAPYFDAYATRGYMGIAEYKRFLIDRINNTGPVAEISAQGGPGAGFNGQNAVWGGSPDTTSLDAAGGKNNKRGKGNEEETEPINVWRFGKLPVQLPDWWEQLDEDKDGQIGLYEWRKAGRDVKEFKDMDLNGDGLLTAEEWIKYQKILFEPKPGEKSEAFAARVGAGNTRVGGRSGPSYGGPNDRSNFGGSGGPNPFTGGTAPPGRPDRAPKPDNGIADVRINNITEGKPSPKQRNSGNLDGGNNGRGNRGGNPPGTGRGGRGGGANGTTGNGAGEENIDS